MNAIFPVLAQNKLRKNRVVPSHFADSFSRLAAINDSPHHSKLAILQHRLSPAGRLSCKAHFA